MTTVDDLLQLSLGQRPRMREPLACAREAAARVSQRSMCEVLSHRWHDGSVCKSVDMNGLRLTIRCDKFIQIHLDLL